MYGGEVGMCDSTIDGVIYFNMYFFLFKQKTAYDMRISDWSSDVCSSDLPCGPLPFRLASSIPASRARRLANGLAKIRVCLALAEAVGMDVDSWVDAWLSATLFTTASTVSTWSLLSDNSAAISTPFSPRSEEHTSELQSLMRISYAVF